MRGLPVPPATVSPDNLDFFSALEEGRLRLPRCRRCASVIWYPRHLCPACGSLEVEWFQASGRGTIHSLTVVHRGALGDWASVGPYVLAYVELEEGPRVLTNILTEDPAGLAIGDAVMMVVDRADGVPPVLRFRPA